ncbi:MAG: hypothetical protein Q8L68_00615, partial [Methylococcales bacterium]|nr:hypothetical protein [Methylococcales bacterium]
GALTVDCIVQDIANGADLLMQKIDKWQFDLVINLVASTSRVKDSEFLPSQLEKYLMSDLLVPVQLLQKLIDKSNKPLKVIFISTVLASVKSPDRLLYGSLKLLQEMCLHNLSYRQGIGLLVVKVGMVIPHKHTSDRSKKLVAAIYQAHLQGKKVLSYGLVGRLYLLLFYTQPLIFGLVVRLQRALRGSAS